MSEDLVKFNLPAPFVSHRVSLRPEELSYGYTHGWIDAGAAVEIAARGAKISDHDAHFAELASLLPTDTWRVDEAIARISDTHDDDVWRVWLFLALAWLREHRHEHAEPLQVVEMIYADFEYPAEIEGLIRFMPPPPGGGVGLAAIEDRWAQYLQDRSHEFASRS